MLELPPRPPEVVPVVIDGPLAAAQRCWQLRPPQDTLVVVVRAMFMIQPGGEVERMAEPLPPIGDLFHADDPAASLRYASDFAPFKPQADVTMVGHAYGRADGGGVTRVQLSCGPLRRAVAAIGNRAWQRGVPSEPAPFDALPLQWELAFGGPGFAANPVGKGLDGRTLPNLEQPDALVRSPRDRPAPACFAPVARTWRARASKLGTYDRGWQEERWPYFPRDFDWSYFNAAPAEQQIPYPRGDESFELAGVHPEQAVLSGRLCGLTPRVFAHYALEAGGEFRELTPNLDTISFDADELAVSLVWRGLLDVSAEHAPEIERLFVCAAELGAPLSVEAARERFVAKLVELHGPAVVREAASAPEAVAAEGQPADRAADAEASEEAPAGGAPPAPVLSREQALLLIGAGTSLEGLSFACCDLTGVDLSGRALTGTYFTDAKLDGACFDEAELSGAVFVRATAKGASFQRAQLTAANLAEAVVAEADFNGAILDGASFADAEGSRARFAGASLGMAKLNDARLVGAAFDRALATGADFSGARLDGASFRQATLHDAQLYDCAAEGACFDDASLLRLRADGAKLTGGSFARAQAAEASFESADLSEAQLGQAELSKAVFSRAKLSRAALTQATATGARFRHACLANVFAAKANLMQANFESADLTGADLRGANLYAVETWKATLDGALLEQALLAASKLAT